MERKISELDVVVGRNVQTYKAGFNGVGEIKDASVLLFENMSVLGTNKPGGLMVHPPISNPTFVESYQVYTDSGELMKTIRNCPVIITYGEEE